MDDALDAPPPGIADTDGIQNLDTARMALRWALERLRKLESEKGEWADKAVAAEHARGRATEEAASLQKSLALRTAEAAQRELYYAKMEEFLSLRLEGKLDLGALAKREQEAAELSALLEQKQLRLERDYAARKEALERDWQALQGQGQREAQLRRRQDEQALEARRTALEQEHLLEMGQLRERQVVLKAEEQALAERKGHFEEYYSAQRAQLHASVKNFKAEIEDEVRLRLELTERMKGERQVALETGWTREKALLTSELASWRLKAQELGPRLLELEKSLDAAEEALQRARSATDRQTLSLAENKQFWELEKAALQTELADWRQRSREELARVQDIGKRLAVAEDRLTQTQAAAERQIAILEGRLAGAAPPPPSSSRP